jgi:hypothetical protein
MPDKRLKRTRQSYCDHEYRPWGYIARDATVPITKDKYGLVWICDHCQKEVGAVTQARIREVH